MYMYCTIRICNNVCMICTIHEKAYLWYVPWIYINGTYISYKQLSRCAPRHPPTYMLLHDMVSFWDPAFIGSAIAFLSRWKKSKRPGSISLIIIIIIILFESHLFVHRASPSSNPDRGRWIWRRWGDWVLCQRQIIPVVGYGKRHRITAKTLALLLVSSHVVWLSPWEWWGYVSYY